METTRILSCGHEPSPHSEHTTGTAHTTDGREICWACADNESREQMKTAASFVVYVGDNNVTTWTGGNLGGILYRSVTHIFGHKGIAYRIRDVHGQVWHGRHAGMFSGKGCALRIRRCK
jgi:hypothetical protein